MAKTARRIAAFLRAPGGRKRMALEAAWNLFIARLATFRHARHYTRRLGSIDAPMRPAPSEQVALAEEIGHVVAVTARAMPFRAVCLQQAIAVRRMLDRRGIPATVHLGLTKDKLARRGEDVTHAAHAWVVTGDRVVNGDIGLDGYVIVGTFS